MANQSLLEVSNQLEALRGDVRGMHNDVDQLTNAMESSRKQQRDLYADLDRRMKALEARSPGSAAPGTASPGAATGSAPSAATGVVLPNILVPAPAKQNLNFARISLRHKPLSRPLPTLNSQESGT